MRNAEFAEKGPAPTTPRSADCNLLKILPILPDHSARWYNPWAADGLALPFDEKNSGTIENLVGTGIGSNEQPSAAN